MLDLVCLFFVVVNDDVEDVDDDPELSWRCGLNDNQTVMFVLSLSAFDISTSIMCQHNIKCCFNFFSLLFFRKMNFNLNHRENEFNLWMSLEEIVLAIFLLYIICSVKLIETSAIQEILKEWKWESKNAKTNQPIHWKPILMWKSMV